MNPNTKAGHPDGEVTLRARLAYALERSERSVRFTTDPAHVGFTRECIHRAAPPGNRPAPTRTAPISAAVKPPARRSAAMAAACIERRPMKVPICSWGEASQ